MPDLLTNVLAEHTYDPVRTLSGVHEFLTYSRMMVLDPDFDDRQEVRAQLPQNASRYMARRLETLLRGSARGLVDLVHRIFVLCVPSV